MTITPIHPDDAAPVVSETPATITVSSRRTLGFRKYGSRRTLGRRGVPSRRTLMPRIRF